MDIFSGLQTFEPYCTTPSLRLINTYDCDCLLQRDVVKKPATTVVGFIFKEGVIMAAADSSSQSVKKIVEINTHMLGTGATDCQSWYKYLGIKCRLYELENERRISLTRASSLLKRIVYSDHHCVGLSAEIMIAGWDEKGPGLYYLQYDVGKIKGDRFSVGSGSQTANLVLDRWYRYDMTIDEAAGLARRSIYNATFPYGASGGTVCYYVGPDGWKKLSGDDGGSDGSKKLSGSEYKKLKLYGPDGSMRLYGNFSGLEGLKEFCGDADGWKKSSGPDDDDGGPDGWDDLSGPEILKKLSSGEDGGPHGWKKWRGGWRKVSLVGTGGTSSELLALERRGVLTLPRSKSPDK